MKLRHCQSGKPHQTRAPQYYSFRGRSYRLVEDHRWLSPGPSIEPPKVPMMNRKMMTVGNEYRGNMIPTVPPPPRYGSQVTSPDRSRLVGLIGA